MYFLYADGSGQAAIKHKSHNNGLYILSGVIVHESVWKTIEENIASLKQDIFPKIHHELWELHAYDIWNNQGFFADEKLKMNFAKKQEIFSKTLDIVCNSQITLLNVIIFKDLLKKRYGTSKTLEYSWKFMVERFEHFLKQQSEETNNGLLYVDASHKSPESEIKNVIYKLVRHENHNQKIDHVVEDPIFKKSHLRNMIQLADMIAYIIQKHYRNDTSFKYWFERLNPKIYQSNGVLDGFGIMEFPL